MDDSKEHDHLCYLVHLLVPLVVTAFLPEPVLNKTVEQDGSSELEHNAKA